MKVIVPGISGLLARIVAKKLLARGHQVVGIDARPWPEAPDGIVVHTTDIRKRGAEDVFRTLRPDAVIHMATVTHLRQKSEDRYRINLGGTRAVWDHCHAYGVPHAIFVGRHTYYGAAPDSPLYHTEEEPPGGATSFPELADLVAADLYAGSALWRYPEITTTVLRVCYTLGPSHHGTLASFLNAPLVPMVLGFDPLFHFIHEDDAAEAIVVALEKKARGVFNVSGPPPLPLSVIAHAAGKRTLPVPESLFRLVLGRFGLPGLPAGAVSHIKYPIVIDSMRFKKTIGFRYEYDAEATIDAFTQRLGAASSN
jgi:UDP-glucose 4-epimerase